VTAAMPNRPPKPSQQLPEASQEAAKLQARYREPTARTRRLEDRLEITEVAECTLWGQLQRERERADRLEEELRDARRSWWSRIFGH
jgi:hypothetical protein